jgi:hypothetical protein
VINDSTICHGVKAKLEAGNVDGKFKVQQRFAEIGSLPQSGIVAVASRQPLPSVVAVKKNSVMKFELTEESAMPLFTRNILWDVNPATFDIQKGRRLVVQRVLMLGTLDDLHLLKTLYSLSDIRNEVMKIKDWDSKVLNFISLWLDIPKDQFVYCTHRHSHLKHWD